MALRILKYNSPSERSQSEKDTYYMIPTIEYYGKGKTVEIVTKSIVSKSWR